MLSFILFSIFKDIYIFFFNQHLPTYILLTNESEKGAWRVLLSCIRCQADAALRTDERHNLETNGEYF